MDPQRRGFHERQAYHQHGAGRDHTGRDKNPTIADRIWLAFLGLSIYAVIGWIIWRAVQ